MLAVYQTKLSAHARLEVTISFLCWWTTIVRKKENRNEVIHQFLLFKRKKKKEPAVFVVCDL